MLIDQTINSIFTIEFRRKHIGWSTWRAFFMNYEDAKHEARQVFPDLKSKDIRIVCWSKSKNSLSAR